MRIAARLRKWAALIVLLNAIASFPLRAATGPTAARSGTHPQKTRTRQPPASHAGLRPFAPGVRIDWDKRQVETDAVVVLREGPLELLACSPRSKEHESILVVQARPLHIFQAMGLIGLEPGRPVHFDETRDRWLPPRGEPLELYIRCPDDGEPSEVPAHRWLWDVNRRRPPDRINWVFAGSRTDRDGRFAADLEGTVACVVDFQTALIAVGDLRTADDDHLWLRAHTDVIPPEETECVLIIRSAVRMAIHVDLAADGTLRRDGKQVSIEDVLAAAREKRDQAQEPTVVMTVSKDVAADRIDALLRALLNGGMDRANLYVRHPAADARAPSEEDEPKLNSPP